jgi:hypothetical protein
MALKKLHMATLTGIVIPTEWDDDQEVVAVALAMPDEQECRILGNRKGRELLGFLQHQVEATGLLDRDDRGKAVMTVKRYNVK